MTLMLEIAQQYVAAGLSVIPIYDGSKATAYKGLRKTTGIDTNFVDEAPGAAWRIYCTRMPTDEELQIWFTDPDNYQIGIVGGAISGGLVRIDFEHRACVDAWLDALDTVAATAAAALPRVETPKGHHIYLRMPSPPGHELLCYRSLSRDDSIVFAETQGEGCYCLAPPSRYGYPPNPQRIYGWVFGGPDRIPTLDQELAQQLLDAARLSGLWEMQLQRDYCDMRLHSYRGGIDLTEYYVSGQYRGEAFKSVHLTWPQVEQLRAYLTHYDTLLRAIETAPPPPPSFDYVYVGQEEYEL